MINQLDDEPWFSPNEPSNIDTLALYTVSPTTGKTLDPLCLFDILNVFISHKKS